MKEKETFSRREFLLGAGITSGLGALVGAGLTKFIDYIPSTPEEERGLLPYDIDSNPILVKKGVNLRTSPQIPDKRRFFKPDNTIEWDDIYQIGGARLNGFPSFIVFNSAIVKGQPIYTDPNSPDSTDEWVKLNATLIGGLSKTLYAHVGKQTLEYVQRLYFPYDTRMSDMTPEKKSWSYQLSKVITSDTENAAGKILPPLFASDSIKKLEGIIPLVKGDLKSQGSYRTDEYIEPADVVGAGDSWEEALEMKEKNIPVNIRNFPSKKYSNGEDIDIIGKLQIGTRINNVLFVDGWGVFKMSDIEGQILPGDDDTTNNHNVGAIMDLYLGHQSALVP